MVVPDMLEHEVFRTSPLVLNAPSFRFYAGTSLVVNGQNVGALCFMDLKPRPDFSEDDQKMLVEIAAIVSSLLTERYESITAAERSAQWVHQTILQVIRSPIIELNSINNQLQVLANNSKTVKQVLPLINTFQAKLSTAEHLLDISLRIVGRLFDADQQGNAEPLLLKLSSRDWLQTLRTSLSHSFLFSRHKQAWLHEDVGDNALSNKSIYSHYDALQLAINCFVSLMGSQSGVLLDSVTIGCKAESAFDLSSIKKISRLSSGDEQDLTHWFSGSLIATISGQSFSSHNDESKSYFQITFLQTILDWVSGSATLSTDNHHYTIYLAIPCVLRNMDISTRSGSFLMQSLETTRETPLTIPNEITVLPDKTNESKSIRSPRSYAFFKYKVHPDTEK